MDLPLSQQSVSGREKKEKKHYKKLGNDSQGERGYESQGERTTIKEASYPHL
jgi:hypothetical protein